jgi:methylated-DNA-[protein]-cysteine S-methyltransferase
MRAEVTTNNHKMAVFSTAWGWMGVAASPRGVCEIILPQPSRSEVERRLSKAISNGQAKGAQPDADPQAARALVERTKGQLVEYLDGKRRDLDVPLDLVCGSTFQRRVWRTIARIPHGRVRSYKWVAMRLGGLGYARAVGNALGANPVPIAVPCHRVIAHDASLGGFSGGLRVKKRLLLLEGTLAQLKVASHKV